MKKVFKGDQGFTLVELIVVIAILGILAGVGTVGYSGYIKKANMAADQQALAHLNTAFITACIENGLDSREVEAAIDVDDDKTVKEDYLVVETTDKVSTEKKAKIEAAFENYFEDVTFKVIEELVYDDANGVFINNDALTFKSGKYSISLTQDQLNAVRDSAYAQMGAGEVTTLLNDLSTWAGKPDVNLAQYAGEYFGDAMASYLGLNNRDELIEYMDDHAADAAKITSNAIVLYAAQNSSDLTTDSLTALMGTLSGSASQEDVEDSLPKNANALAQVSAIYGLYTAYAHENNIEGESGAIEVLINASKDAAFGEWIKGERGQKNTEAYLAAMDVIGSNASNSDTATDLLNNGYADDELVALMTEILGKQ